MTISVERLIELGKQKGRIIERCVDAKFAAVDCGPAPDTNERMRLTADGAMLIVNEGRYWQVGTLNEVYDGLKRIT